MLARNVFELKRITRGFSSFYGSGRSTIYALATGSVRSALAVIRVSGPNCQEIVSKVGGFGAKKLPEERKAILRKFRDPITLDILDIGILLWFPAPNSYTGEDCCELHIHGGPAVISSVLQALGKVHGSRIAEPGEFTKRAFLNGKMDLTEVDGLRDLIDAETEMQRIQALHQMDGSLSRIYEPWRDRIAKCLANSEAYIDFGEDEAIESDVIENVEKDVKILVEEIEHHLTDQGKGQRLRDGVRVAIIGQTNAGKSTLLNLLSKREAAIVSRIPGTTRDVIESCVKIHGFPIIFCDTAGIRSLPSDEIEAEGIRRSMAELTKADLIILLIDALQNSVNDESEMTRSDVIRKQLALHSFQGDANNDEKLEKKTLVVLNKLDLISGKFPFDYFDSSISCKTSEGVEKFHQLLVKRIEKLCGNPKHDAPCVTQERYRSELKSCVESLLFFLDSLNSSDLALRVNYLKNAINAIGSITGHVDKEHILDIIFRDFCIGK